MTNRETNKKTEKRQKKSDKKIDKNTEKNTEKNTDKMRDISFRQETTNRHRDIIQLGGRGKKFGVGIKFRKNSTRT